MQNLAKRFFTDLKTGPIRRIKSPLQVMQPLRRETLPVIGVCTAEAYNFRELCEFLSSKYACSPLKCDDVLHCKLESGETFIFESGSFVFWPNGRQYESAIGSLSRLLKPYESGPIPNPEMEELDFQNGSVQNPKIDGECLILPEELPKDDPSVIMSKLAFSNGLADSVKLATLENYLQEHIEKVKDIPAMLQSGGKLQLTRSKVLQLIGELLHFRSVLNLRSELIDTPELYWSEPALESLYLKTSKLLETRTRISILNKKLDYANEMAQVLRSHLSEQHGLKLEWGIIALIAVEVVFELVHYIK